MKDFLKEKLSWYKLLNTLLITLTAGMIGWLVSNYKVADVWLVYFSIFGVILFSLIISICYYKVRFYLSKLEVNND